MRTYRLIPFLQLTSHFPDCNLFDLCVEVIESNEAIRREILCHQDDSQHWIEVFATRLRDGVVTRLKDVSATKAQLATLESVKQELYTLATTDGLTKVANRYCFDSYLQAEWQRLTRDQQPFSLLLRRGDL
jgi:two-component system cell cycle response regulator